MLLTTQVTETIVLLSIHRANGESLQATTKLCQCRLEGSSGGKCRVSASVDRLVMSIQINGDAISSAAGMSTTCQPDGRRLLRRSAAGSTRSARSTVVINAPRPAPAAHG